MWVTSDVTSGRNRHWEWRPETGDTEDGKTTLEASGRGARASDAGLTFADDCLLVEWGHSQMKSQFGRFSESSWASVQGQTVFALCSDELNC